MHDKNYINVYDINIQNYCNKVSDQSISLEVKKKSNTLYT